MFVHLNVYIKPFSEAVVLEAFVQARALSLPFKLILFNFQFPVRFTTTTTTMKNA